MNTKISLLITAMLLLFLVSCQTQEKPKEPPCDCEKLRIPAFKNEVKGAEAVLLKGTEAGYSLDSLPGVKTITTEELLKMEGEPETGLYLLDMDFIPQELAENLKTEGYRLQKDGTLDSAGVKVTLFVHTAVYSLKKRTDQPTARPDSLDLGTAPPTTRAAPLPWASYSYSFWWKYEGGFCRRYKASSRAYAYGPRIGTFRPYTNIQWIQAYATTWGKSDLGVCNNCFTETAYVNSKIGCFWVAHGSGTGSHYIFMYDLGTSIFVDWGWSH